MFIQNFFLMHLYGIKVNKIALAYIHKTKMNYSNLIDNKKIFIFKLQMIVSNKLKNFQFHYFHNQIY